MYTYTVFLAGGATVWLSRDVVVVSRSLDGWNEITKWALGLHTETFEKTDKKEIDIAWPNNQLG